MPADHGIYFRDSYHFVAATVTQIFELPKRPAFRDFANQWIRAIQWTEKQSRPTI